MIAARDAAHRITTQAIAAEHGLTFDIAKVHDNYLEAPYVTPNPHLDAQRRHEAYPRDQR